MLQCPRCGVTNEIGSRFCAACGAPVIPQNASGWPGPWPSGNSVAQNAVPAAWPAPVPTAPGPAGPPVRYQVGDPRNLNPYGQTFQPDVPVRRATPPLQTAEISRSAPRSVTLASAKPGLDPESVPRGAPRVLAGFLVSYADTRGIHWPIFQGVNTVGRRGSDAVDIPVDDATTSSRHATILASACPGRMKIEDLASTNGTFVGPTRLVAGQRRELSDGEQVRFGGFSVIVKII